MIFRIWHGWTRLDDAHQYERLLTKEIFTGIRDRQISGFRNIKLLCREVEREVEFVTIMTFDSVDAVIEFAGEDYEEAVVPEAARVLLTRFDLRSQHYVIRSECGE